jgi:hypothetical protein
MNLADAGCENVTWRGGSPNTPHLAFYGGTRGEPNRLCLLSRGAGKITTSDVRPRVPWSPPHAWADRRRWRR